ncbi:MAG: heptosyltransferase family [uncultured bacterium]|nr:MAG: heptosyltransferase family [uncultured bacterium]HBH18614.1 hypothetical protein [Cyanobacteria bacterium UBA9579]
MNLVKSSLFLRLLNKLDIQEDSSLVQAMNNSFIFNKLNGLLGFIQDKMSYFAQSSKLVKNLDNYILILISLLIIAIPFASTKIIGFITVAAFALLAMKFCCVKGEKHNFTSFDIPIFLYIAIVGISVAFSSLLIPSIKGYVKMLIYFGGYLTFLNVLRGKPKRVIYLMGVIALSATAEAFCAIYQQVIGVEALASWQDNTEVNPEQLMNRVYGTLKPFNPNLLAGYLVATFSSALGLAFWFLHKKNVRLTLLAFIGTAAILLAIVFTGSRGAYIATAGMSFVFVLLSGHIIWHDYGHIKWLKKLWIASIIAGIALVILAVLLSPSLLHRIGSIFAFRADSSNSYRFNVYASSIKMFLDNWIIGIGPGNTTFRLIYGLYMVTGFDALGTYSVPLEIAVESGIFGLLIFSWLILFSFIKGVKYICNKANLLENKIIVSSCLIGITGLMTHGLVDTIWYRPQVNLIFWMLIAILCTMTTSSFSLSQKQE